ncbi:hypothetical protein VO68_12480 [Aeromonas salmonicida]|nr:hypothetical protein VO68_12480 [Aeromonas salmonicida]
MCMRSPNQARVTLDDVASLIAVVLTTKLQWMTLLSDLEDNSNTWENGIPIQRINLLLQQRI